MNAAAAHVAFVMTVSAASMYWLLRHAQHARDINIHKLHPLPEKKSAWAALPIFCTVLLFPPRLVCDLELSPMTFTNVT